VGELFSERDRVLLEVGPGQSLSTLALQHPARGPEHAVVGSLRHLQDPRPDFDVLLEALSQLWLAGVRIDWRGFTARERRRRVPLPTYPFERLRHWIEPRAAGAAAAPGPPARREDLASWFYVPAWRQALPAGTPGELPDLPGLPERWLLLLDDCGLGAGLAERLAGQGREVVTARPGEDLEALLRELDTAGRFPEMVVHLGSVTASPAAGTDTALDLGFHSLLALARALGRWPAHPVRVAVVSSGVQAVTGEEEIQPEKAALLGPVRVVPQEMAHLSWRSIDVEPPGGDGRRDRQIDLLLAELAAPDPGADIAHRGTRRWVQGFEPVRLEKHEGMPGRLREQGIYLITGGLGGVGLEIAAYLARTVRARLILTGRSELPPREAWEGWLAAHGEGDRTASRIRKLLAIEAAGGKVRPLRADVTDLEAMRGAFAAARAEFGALHGVIHAAGVAAGGMVEWKTPAAVAAVLAPKISGARVLAQLLAGAELDFVVLCSAANSALGGFGQVDLSAASAFLDALAVAWTGPSPCLAVDWDTWREVGAAVEAEVPPDLAELHREGLRHGMTSAEGVEVFARLLRAGLPRMVVSTRELGALLARARERGGTDPLAGREPARPGIAGIAGIAGMARPSLRNPYVEPAGEVERAVSALWQEMMGIEQIGVHDSFFQLGGHSLLATQIVSRLRDLYQVELPIAGFFEAPTVAGLAALVQGQLFLRAAGADAAGAGDTGGAGNANDEELERLMAEIEGLSGEEAEALLGQGSRGGGADG
jgi:NAD(P)-dependent dehydrogenase (short-subunit alcohol dehydrogenase family)/acyl carrier protein